MSVNTLLLALSISLSCVLLFTIIVYHILARRLVARSPFVASIVDLTDSRGDIDPIKHIRHLAKSTTEFGIQYSELKMGKMIGKGSQGEVFKASWRGSTVAVKKVDTRKVPPEIIEEFCMEANIMRRLRHPALCLFMGVSLEHPHLCIVTEIVARGSLFDIIHDEHGALTWQKCVGIATDVARGMVYLHAHSPAILHRDLKSLNILVDDHWRGKVADFGMTRFQEGEVGAIMTQCGSPLWMAPEMIRNDPYDEKSDVYSFAICLWEMYTRKIPYRDLGLSPSHLVVKVVKENLRPPIPRHCPKPYKQLMEICWHASPEKRLSFPDILRQLESMLTDPIVMNHKPLSSRADATVALRPEHISDDALASVLPVAGQADGMIGGGMTAITHALGLQSGERAWKISPNDLTFYTPQDGLAVYKQLVAAGALDSIVGLNVAGSPHASRIGAHPASPSLHRFAAGAGGKSNISVDSPRASPAAGFGAGAGGADGLPPRPLRKGEKPGSAAEEAAMARARGSVQQPVGLSRMSTAKDVSGPPSPISRAATTLGGTGLGAGLTVHVSSSQTQGSIAVSQPGRSNTNFSSSSSGSGSEAELVDAAKHMVLPSQGSPFILLGAYHSRVVSIKICFIPRSLLVLTNAERVAADLDGGMKNTPIAEFMLGMSGLRHPNIVLFQGAYLDQVENLKAKVKRSGQWSREQIATPVGGTPMTPTQRAINALSSSTPLSQTSHSSQSPFPQLFASAPPECDMYLGCVSEFLARGPLSALLCDPNLMIPWETMIQLLEDAASGLAYLHGNLPKPIIHQALTSEKLLVDKNWRVKVNEYGFVDLQSSMDGTCMPPSVWSAPEYIKSPTMANMTRAGNVYSFGNIIWQALARRPLWGGSTLTKSLAERISKNHERPPLLVASSSSGLHQLTEQCWLQDPSARPTFSRILEELARLKKIGPPKIELNKGVNAHIYRKAKTVFAYRSKDPVTMLKDWGTNIGVRDCIIIFSGDDDVYLCAEDVFKSSYEKIEPVEVIRMMSITNGTPRVDDDHTSERDALIDPIISPLPLPASPAARLLDLDTTRRHEYRKTGTILARCVEYAFSVKAATEGGTTEHGMAGDYLVQNEQGDQWSIEAKTFMELYERCE